MENLTFFSLFLIGLSYGATACMFSCMPFLAPLLVSNSKTLQQSISVVLPFSLGRVFTYITIALVAFSSSVLVKHILQNNTMFQMLLGGLTVAVGAVLLSKTLRDEKSGCKMTSTSLNTKSKLGLFGIGALVSLNPCAPVLTLIGLSANTTSFVNALGYGVFFGLGAILVPFVIYAFLLGTTLGGLIEQFRKYKKIIEIFAASLLILTGSLVFAGKISL